MEELLEALKAKGAVLAPDTDEKTIKKVARSMGIDWKEHVGRQPARLVEHTNKRKETKLFIETDPFVIGRDSKGKIQTARGLFLRADALDQYIDDLVQARELLRKG